MKLKMKKKEKEEHMDNQEWESIVTLGDSQWKEIALEVLSSYTKRTDGSWIEDKEFGIVWHFEIADPEYGRMQADEVTKLLKRVMKNPTIDIILYDNHRILEVKPHGVSKGSAASRILQQVLKLPTFCNPLPLPQPQTTTTSVSAPSTPARRFERKEQKDLPFLLCVGDDKSDEDMFKAVEATSDYLKTGQIPESKRFSFLIDPHSPRGLDHHLNLPISNSSFSSQQLQRNSTFTICVGIKHSEARYYLQDDTEVRQLLQAIAEAHRGSSSGGQTPVTDG